MAHFDFDVLIIGSGFGGSVSALRLAEKGYRVGVLEAGRRFTDDDPAPDVLAAEGLPVGAEAGPDGDPAHPRAARTSWCSRARAWAAARSSTPTPSTCPASRSSTTRSGAASPTGPTSSRPTTTRPPACSASSRTRRMTPADEVMKAVADEMGVGHTFRLTPVGVYFGDGPGVTRPDPVLRRRGPGAHRLHRVRRVHDRLPAQRQEHAARRTTWPWRRRRARACTR